MPGRWSFWRRSCSVIQIPDAPWVRDPERYADDYYGGCYEQEETEEEWDDDC